MTQKTATVLLKYSTDQSTVQTAVLANTKVLQSIQDVGIQAQTVADQLAAMGVSLNDVTVGGDKIAANLTTPLDKADASAQSLVATIHDIGLQINALPEPNLSAFGVADSTVGDGSSLTGARSGLRAGAGLVGAAAGGGSLREAGQIVTLVSALGPVGLLAGGAALGLRALTSAEDAAEKSFQSGLDAQRQAAHTVEGLTTQEVQAKITAAQSSLAIDQEVSRKQTANAALYTLSIVDQPLKLGAALAGLDPTYNAYQNALAANGVAIEGDKALIDAYTGAIGENAGAAADAVAAYKLQQTAIEDSNKALIALYDKQAQTNTDLAALRRTGTTDEINNELAANKDRETIIQTYLLPNVTKIGLSSAAASARLLELHTELGDLTAKDQQLLNAVLPVIAAREAETKLLADQKSQSDAVNSVLQDINKAQVDLAAASQKTADALTAVGQAETDHANNLQTIQQTYDTAQQDALSKKNTALAKIDQQAAERQLQQKENDNLSILQAVARGDIASAQATLAQQKVKDDQDQRQIAQQKVDTQQAYNDALDAAKIQNKKLIDAESDRYTKELATRRDAYNKAYQDEQAQNARLQSLRDQQTAIERYWISTTVVDMYKITDATNSLSQAAQSYADRVNADIQARTISGQSGGSAGGATVGSGSGVISTPGAGPGGLPQVTGTGASKRTITQYDDGGISMKPGIFYAGVPEAHIPLSMLGASSVVFNIDAKGSNLSEAEWQKRMEPLKIEIVQKLTDLHQRQKH